MQNRGKQEEKRLDTKQLWIIIAGLIGLYFVTIAFFLTKQGVFSSVAIVSAEKIMMQDLQDELKVQYGEGVLEDLIDRKVIEWTAEKHGIEVGDAAVERELLRLRLTYGISGNPMEEEQWREKIKYQILLEEITTRDAIFSDTELKTYYENHSNTYSFPTLYHVSQITVATEEEAAQVIKELEDGSDFVVLAMERTADEVGVSQGGDIGYVTGEDDNAHVFLKKLKPGQYSKPIPTKEGYAILLLHDYIKGKKYSYNEVKEDVRRHLALEKVEGVPSTKTLRNDVDIEWLYGD